MTNELSDRAASWAQRYSSAQDESIEQYEPADSSEPSEPSEPSDNSEHPENYEIMSALETNSIQRERYYTSK